MNAIHGVQAFQALAAPTDVGAVAPLWEGGGQAAAVDGAFAAKLDTAIGSVNETVTEADDALFALAAGTEVDLHGAMIALEEAEIALRAMVSVRDKVIAAYESLLNLAI